MIGGDIKSGEKVDARTAGKVQTSAEQLDSAHNYAQQTEDIQWKNHELHIQAIVILFIF